MYGMICCDCLGDKGLLGEDGSVGDKGSKGAKGMKGRIELVVLRNCIAMVRSFEVLFVVVSVSILYVKSRFVNF